jgi:hypothetical protein
LSDPLAPGPLLHDALVDLTQEINLNSDTFSPDPETSHRDAGPALAEEDTEPAQQSVEVLYTKYQFFRGKNSYRSSAAMLTPIC